MTIYCAARRQGTAGGNDPTDCDWPRCGCEQTKAQPSTDIMGDDLCALRQTVEEQANDEMLWCGAGTIVEAHLQQELRRLHEMIERSTRWWMPP